MYLVNSKFLFHIILSVSKNLAYTKLWYHWGVICIKPQILTENGTEFCGPVAASSDLIIASCA